jgi:DNA-directed RNA polymerase specialized sigma24 family protein
MLRSRKSRREELLDAQHLPDPIVDRAEGIDPEHEALLADSLGLALLVVLETLTPAERLAYVLHDMFSVPFDEIGAILECSPEAERQLASRARRRFNSRYATFSFSDEANLDEGAMWATSFALKELSGAEEAKIGALVKKAVS